MASSAKFTVQGTPDWYESSATFLSATKCQKEGIDSSGNGLSSKKCFPFTTVIVTNPDEASAWSAQRLLDSTMQNHLKALYPHQDVRLLSTYDPFGARCGSFGGTLGALDLLDVSTLPNETILCLHAGGDSSRCPLSMIIGKAWQELPSSKYRNPTFWLIHQLEELYNIAQIPPGSLCVAATDCLISLGPAYSSTMMTDNPGDASCIYALPVDIDPNTVLGVCVPAPLNVAKNHGVYVMPQTALQTAGKVHIESPLGVWQKPSLEQLSGNFKDEQVSFDVPQKEGRQAWIDVGIVIFYPQAFQNVIKMSEGVLSKCTRRGLQEAYQSANTDTSLQQYAKENAIKVDLYTDILHNLPWPAKEGNKNVANQSSSVDGSSRNLSLKEILSDMLLKVLVLPQGNFLHLGTTTELLEFITFGSNRSNKSILPKAVDKSTTWDLATSLQLNARFRSWPEAFSLDEFDKTNVVLRSVFPNTPNAEIKLGISSLVEFSDLSAYHTVKIGGNCMLSGWRCPMKENLSENGKHWTLEIPDALSVQLLQMLSDQGDNKRKDEVSNQGKFVLMVLGTNDAIKTPILQANIFGSPLEKFLYLSKASLVELGMEDTKKFLWDAKIHPIVKACEIPESFSKYFGWIEQFRAGDKNLQSDTSFMRWLSTKKVSLKELHQFADATKEWEYRCYLETKLWQLHADKKIANLRLLVEERQYGIPCELDWLLKIHDKNLAYTSLCTLVSMLGQVATKAFREKKFDISGRAFMLASSILVEFQEHLPTNQSPAIALAAKFDILFCDLRHLLFEAQSLDRACQFVDDIVILQNQIMQPTTLGKCSEVLERLAQQMTTLIIFSGFQMFLDPAKPEKIQYIRMGEPRIDRWVISVASARVDLAGGWSDTPPICYEYGGSVTGMAVLVDDYFPLSCRCCLVGGKTGIMLRSEMRDICDGALLDQQQVEITCTTDINGFQDPSTSCALIKASLICLGLITENQILKSQSLQPILNSFCGSTEDVCLEVVTTSLLGLGTGMGTSSILAACILQSIAESVGIGKMSTDMLLHAVLMVEQILSSGGGWQDQAHGILPGIKTIASMPPQIPLKMQIKLLNLSPQGISSLEERLMFAYTGQTRLAKNILQEVLRRWSRRTPEIVETVESLVRYSGQMHEACLNEDWDTVADLMYQSYQMKCAMAGKNSGAEPTAVKIFISKLVKSGLIKGAMLCGAGGGGFLMLICSKGVKKKEVNNFFVENIAPLCKDFEKFSFHECTIAPRGLSTSIIGEEVTMNSFDLSWHKMLHGDDDV